MAHPTLPQEHSHDAAVSPFPDHRENRDYQTRRHTLIGFDWAKALRDLGDQVPSLLRCQFEREVREFDRDGWRYLLPAQASKGHVVCLEARFGTTSISLSEVSDQITLVHHHPAVLLLCQRRADASGVHGLTLRKLEHGEFRLPFADASVDAFVYHDLYGAYHDQAGIPRRDFDVLSPGALREIRRVLKPDGYIYLGLPNPYSVSRLARAWRGLLGQGLPAVGQRQGCVRPGAVKRALAAAGFQSQATYPYLEYGGAVTEVLPPQGYRSVKDSLMRSERIKEIMFSEIGAKYIAPAYGYVGLYASTQKTRLLDTLVTAALGPVHQAGSRLQKYLILTGKVILVLQDHVIVIPRFNKTLEGRQREQANIRELSQEETPMRRYLPTGYRDFTQNGESGFVMNAFPGITLDAHLGNLSQVTHEAARLLADFHRATARTTNLSPEQYGEFIGWIIGHLETHYPIFASESAAIDRLLREQLLGNAFVSVWLHGDYKLENLVLDRRTLAIEGVVDWEHARRQGLPLLDLYYLIAYNRRQSEPPDLFRYFPLWLVDGQFSEEEQRMLDDYLAQVPVPAPARRALLALFFIHHVSVRLDLNMAREDMRAGVASCLHRIIDYLAKQPVAGPGA